MVSLAFPRVHAIVQSGNVKQFATGRGEVVETIAKELRRGRLGMYHNNCPPEASIGARVPSPFRATSPSCQCFSFSSCSALHPI